MMVYATISFKLTVVQLILLIPGIWTHPQYNSDDFSDLSTLGQRISNSVQAHVSSSLDGLGASITNKINQKLVPISNGQLEADIQNNIASGLAGLDTLGERISQNVYQELEPIRALEVKLKLMNGVGGVTVAKYPTGTSFIMNNYQRWKCEGQISQENDKCQGTLTRFSLKNKNDVCYVNSYSRVNDNLCIAGGSVSFTVINNVVNCKSTDSNPAFLVTIDEYNKLCGQSRDVNYTYIPNFNDPNHINVSAVEKYVKCQSGGPPSRCQFTESVDGNSGGFGSSFVFGSDGGTQYAYSGVF